MPRDGSMLLSDVRGPTLAIVCEPCGGSGAITSLIAAHGADVKLPGLLQTLANCPKARSVTSQQPPQAPPQATGRFSE